MAIGLPSADLSATVALNLCIAVVVGASLSGAWLRKGASPWAAGQAARLRLVILFASGAAIAFHIALLWLAAASMAEVPLAEAAPAVHATLTATHFGYAWIIGSASLVVITAGAAVPWQPKYAPAAGTLRILALAAFLYSRSIVSHAAADGDFTWAVAADWLHLALISAWVGEVLIAGLVTLRAAAGASSGERLDRARYVQALSNSATVALAGIIATGLLAAWRGLGSFDNATGNPYASILLIKLALVGGAALLGGINRLYVMPGLLDHLRGNVGQRNSSDRMFAAVLQVESVLLVAALSLAAMLSSTSPPAGG